MIAFWRWKILAKFRLIWQGQTGAVNQHNTMRPPFPAGHAGRRVTKEAGGVTTQYCYDGDQVIAEYENGKL